jgi:TnpA family transposase
MLALHLLQICLVYINTLMIQRARPSPIGRNACWQVIYGP